MPGDQRHSSSGRDRPAAPCHRGPHRGPLASATPVVLSPWDGAAEGSDAAEAKTQETRLCRADHCRPGLPLGATKYLRPVSSRAR